MGRFQRVAFRMGGIGDSLGSVVDCCGLQDAAVRRTWHVFPTAGPYVLKYRGGQSGDSWLNVQLSSSFLQTGVPHLLVSPAVASLDALYDISFQVSPSDCEDFSSFHPLSSHTAKASLASFSGPLHLNKCCSGPSSSQHGFRFIATVVNTWPLPCRNGRTQYEW